MYDTNFDSCGPLILTAADIPLFLKLQTKALKALPEDEKHFLKPRTAKNLKGHMAAPMPVIGIKKNGFLTAQALLTFPKYDDSVVNLNGYPVSNEDCTTAVLQSLCVDPDIKGKGLSQKILHAAVTIASMKGYCHILAKVAKTNAPSMASFLKSGFQCACEGTDPAEKYPVYYFKYDVFQGCGAASTTVALAAKMP